MVSANEPASFELARWRSVLEAPIPIYLLAIGRSTNPLGNFSMAAARLLPAFLWSDHVIE